MLFGKAETQMPVGWGGKVQTQVTRKPSEAGVPLGLALGSSRRKALCRDGMCFSSVFTESLLHARKGWEQQWTK